MLAIVVRSAISVAIMVAIFNTLLAMELMSVCHGPPLPTCLAPTYLQDRCRLASEVSSDRRLRSANVPTFVMPRTRTKLGDHSFVEAGPRLRNSLPGPLRQSETLATFKRQAAAPSDFLILGAGYKSPY